MKFTDFQLHSKMDLKKQDRTTDKSDGRWVSFPFLPVFVEFCEYMSEFSLGFFYYIISRAPESSPPHPLSQKNLPNQIIP
jgi:hypothetical protein